MADNATVSFKVSVGDQVFRVRIPADEKPFYERVARYTETAYQEISDQIVTGGPQAWAMAAFQIACDLIEAQEGGGSSVQDRARIKRLIERIEEAAPGA